MHRTFNAWIVILTLAASAPPVAALDSEVQALADWGFSGLIIQGQGDQLTALHAVGMADREAGLPFTPATRLPWLSLSKAMTAALLLQMTVDQQLALDDPLSEHFQAVPESMAAITLENLLTHQSGLAAQLRNPAVPLAPEFEAIDRNTLESRIWRSEPLAPAGQAFIYSNLGYNLAAAAAENAAGRDFQTLLRSRLLDPADMASVHLGRGPEGSVETVGYELAHRWGRFGERAWPDGLPGWNLIGAGGLSSDSRGLIQLGQLIRGAAPMDEQAENWRTPRLRLSGGERYALGLSLSRDSRGERIGHDGGFGPLSTELAWWPTRDEWLIVASNHRHFRAWDVRAVLSDPERSVPPAPSQALASDLSSGTHWRVHHPDGGCWLLARLDDRLEIRSEGAGAIRPLLTGQPHNERNAKPQAQLDRLRALLTQTRHRPDPRDSREAVVMDRLPTELKDRLSNPVQGIDFLGTHYFDDASHSEFRLRGQDETVVLHIQQSPSGHWRDLDWSPRESGVTAVLRYAGEGHFDGMETRRLQATERFQLTDNHLSTEHGWQLNLEHRIPVSADDRLFDSPCGPD